MKVSDVKRLIKNVVRTDHHEPILMIGSQGIGKTAIVEQVCQELEEEFGDFGFVDLRLSTKEPAEVSGYPYRSEIKTKYGKRDAMMYALPWWFPAEGTRGVIFLDELNRSHVDVRHGIMQLVHERRLENYKLPKGWHVIGAMNPDTLDYQVEQIDKALLRRFCAVKVQSDVDTWLTWAKSNGVDDKTTMFVAGNKELLTLDEQFSIDAKPSQDQWTRISYALQANVIPDDLVYEFVAGLVGVKAAAVYMKWRDDNFKRPVSGKEILDHFDKVKDKLLAQKNDEDFVTLSELRAELSVDPNPTKKRIDNLIKFIVDSKPEMKAAFISNLPEKYSNELLKHREVTKAIAQVTQASRR